MVFTLVSLKTLEYDNFSMSVYEGVTLTVV